MKRLMPCRLIGILVLSAAAVASAAPVAGNDQEKLQPGKTPGTFHLIYHGTVGFTMKPEFPTVVSIGSEVTGAVAKMTVTDGKPFTLEADVDPGTYWISSDPAGDPAKSEYQQANGGQLHIDQHGNLSFPFAGMPLLLVHKMSGLSPANGDVADSDPPVLKWTKVEGAKFYRGSYNAGTEWKDFKTDAPSFTLPQLPKETYCTWEIYAQDEQDQTLASGITDFSSHGTARTPHWNFSKAATEPAPNDGFMGIIFAPSGDYSDPFWRSVVGPTTQPVEKDPGIRVASVMPDSAALKADVRPGDLIVALDGKPAAKSGQSNNAYDIADLSGQIRAAAPGAVVTLTIRRDGEELKRQITLDAMPPWLIGGVEKMSGLWPANDWMADSDPPVLKWDPVVGAKRYKGAFLSGIQGKIFETDTASYTLPSLKPPAQCYWWVCAIDDRGRTLANGGSLFFVHGTDMEAFLFPDGGYLGIEPYSFWVTKDPAGTHRFDKSPFGVAMSAGPTIPCILVFEVKPGSPALKAGIQPGDWIIAVDEKPIAGIKGQDVVMGDTQALAAQIRAMKPGTVVTFTIRRDSKELKIPVTIAAMPGRAKAPATQPKAEPNKGY